LSIKFDPIHFSYYTGQTAAGLVANLFSANSSTFLNYTNPLLYPQWVDPGTQTILHMDRYNSLNPFLGNARYGTINNIIPKYNPSDYT